MLTWYLAVPTLRLAGHLCIPNPERKQCQGPLHPTGCVFFLFFNFYLFSWLHQVLVGAQQLSCSVVCGILVPWPGNKPVSLTLQGRFLTTGPPGKSPATDFLTGNLKEREGLILVQPIRLCGRNLSWEKWACVMPAKRTSERGTLFGCSAMCTLKYSLKLGPRVWNMLYLHIQIYPEEENNFSFWSGWNSQANCSISLPNVLGWPKCLFGFFPLMS